MFALMCLTVPLALIPYDAEGLPMPIGVTARYGSPRYVMPSNEYRVRFLPGEKTAMSLTANAMFVWNLETGLRIREIVEPDWVFKDFRFIRQVRTRLCGLRKCVARRIPGRGSRRLGVGAS